MHKKARTRGTARTIVRWTVCWGTLRPRATVHMQHARAVAHTPVAGILKGLKEQEASFIPTERSRGRLLCPAYKHRAGDGIRRSWADGSEAPFLPLQSRRRRRRDSQGQTRRSLICPEPFFPGGRTPPSLVGHLRSRAGGKVAAGSGTTKPRPRATSRLAQIDLHQCMLPASSRRSAAGISSAAAYPRHH